MSIFNLTDEKMKETSSTFTAHEIYQQPATWRKTCAQLAACKDELQAFIDQVVKQDDFDIVLTGAGTSEFVGNSLFQALNPKYNYQGQVLRFYRPCALSREFPLPHQAHPAGELWPLGQLPRVSGQRGGR